MIDIKKITNGDGQGALSVEKNEKITRTVPSQSKIKFYIFYRPGRLAGSGRFFYIYYYIISSM